MPRRASVVEHLSRDDLTERYRAARDPVERLIFTHKWTERALDDLING